MSDASVRYEYEITSPQNEKFKFLCRLNSGKDLKHEDHFLLSGRKLIQEFLQQKLEARWPIVAEITSHLTDSPRQSKAPLWFLDKKLFSEVDSVKTNFNLLLLKKPEVRELDLDSEPQGMEVILPLGDPGNLGSMIRSCEAFGASRVILTAESAQAFLPKAVKAASGSLFRVELRKGPPLSAFKTAKGPLIMLDGSGADLSQFQWPRHFRLILGEEGPGLPEDLPGTKLRIPVRGVESLNATVAASIAMFQASLGTSHKV